MGAEARDDANQNAQSLQVDIEMLANLIYLARHTQANSAQQNEYLDRAARIVEQIAYNPMLCE
jgi:hypothetical protein